MGLPQSKPTRQEIRDYVSHTVNNVMSDSCTSTTMVRQSINIGEAVIDFNHSGCDVSVANKAYIQLDCVLSQTYDAIAAAMVEDLKGMSEAKQKRWEKSLRQARLLKGDAKVSSISSSELSQTLSKACETATTAIQEIDIGRLAVRCTGASEFAISNETVATSECVIGKIADAYDDTTMTAFEKVPLQAYMAAICVFLLTLLMRT